MNTPAELRITTALRGMEFFKNMDKVHLHKVAAIAREVSFAEGEIIYRQGEAGQGIYLVQEGEVVVEMDVPEYGMVQLLRVGPGQLFGWSSLVPGRRKQAQARAAQPVQAIFINANRLRELCRADHELDRVVNLRLTELVANRVNQTRVQLARTLASR